MPLDFSWTPVSGPLVPLADVKTFLRITDPARDAEVTLIYRGAEEFVIAYLGAGGDPAWTDQTVPRTVANAILLQTGFLWEYRGDPSTGRDIDRPIAPFAVLDLLARHRDPTLA